MPKTRVSAIGQTKDAYGSGKISQISRIAEHILQKCRGDSNLKGGGFCIFWQLAQISPHKIKFYPKI